MFINMETGELLEYQKLLNNPKFRYNWSTSMAYDVG
jgi:hypothetical protein